jgi:hypothetical protein
MEAVMNIDSNGLIAVILALQFAAFGWRINREIPVGDAGRKTWFPVPDIINVLSMFGVVLFCILMPLASGQFTAASRVALAAAFVLIAFHPICMIGHYHLFSAQGRHIYTSKKQDYPYCTRAELVLVIVAALLAADAAWYVA